MGHSRREGRVELSSTLPPASISAAYQYAQRHGGAPAGYVSQNTRCVGKKHEKGGEKGKESVRAKPVRVMIIHSLNS